MGFNHIVLLTICNHELENYSFIWISPTNRHNAKYSKTCSIRNYKKKIKNLKKVGKKSIFLYRFKNKIVLFKTPIIIFFMIMPIILL